LVPVAFAASSHPWQQRLNRHLHAYSTDVQVVAIVADPGDLWESEWRVLVIDAASPWLTVAFCEDVHLRSRGIVAIYDPGDARRKQRALDAGADVPLEWDAEPAELVATVHAVAARWPASAGAASRPRPPARSAISRGGAVIAVGGPPGTRPERVAVALASALAGGELPVCVVDANEVDPSLAVRLALHPQPNVATAAARPATILSQLVAEDLQAVPDAGVWALAGLADPAQWTTVTGQALRRTVEALAEAHAYVVALVGPIVEDQPRFTMSRTAVSMARGIVAVGEATPLGIAALTGWIADAVRTTEVTPVYPAAVQSGLSRSQRADVAEALAKVARLAPGPGTVTLLPAPGRRDRARSWDGRVAPERKLAAAVRDLAAQVRA